MLQLILGSGGSGKTTAIHTAVGQHIASGAAGGCMLIVPEQYSFETERRMLALLGAENAQKVEVVSFRRLADFVFRRHGRPQGTVLTDGGRNILMSLALEEVGAELTFYQGYADTDALISMLLSFSRELKWCNISAEEFLAYQPKTEDETLRTKIHDIGLILSAYEALAAQSYVDPLDDLSRIRTVIAEQNVFAGYSVFIDGFKDFTVQQLDLIKLILQQAQQLTVALCTDQLHDPECGRGLFAPACKTASTLMHMARENSVTVAVPRQLEPGVRFRAEELAFLERNLFRAEQEKWSGAVEAVQCFSGKSRYDEAAFIAQEIRRLVMEQGYRYRDFAVITRRLQPYRGVLDAAFDRHEIAYFIDDPKAIDSEPIMQAVLSAFRILTSYYDSETIFAYLKTGMVDGFTANEIAMLENYTYTWKISGKRWREPWTANPSGFTEGFSEEEQADLEHLNELRERLLAPLQQLAVSLQGKTGREISAAVYDFLLSIGADQCVRRLVGKLRGMGQFTLAEEQLRLWELLMSVLDQMALILHDTAVTKERYISLLQLVLNSSEIAGIPAGVDQVTIGEAGRMRPADPKVVFLLGAVQDEFPAPAKESGAFCDRERQAMIELGLPLTSTLDDLESDETYLAYTAAVSGSERLYVTWFNTDLTGELKTPSSLVKAIRAVLPETRVRTRTMMPKEREAMTKETAFALLAKETRGKSLLASTLEELFAEDETYRSRMEALERTVSGKPQRFTDPGKAKQLFPQEMNLSASQIEVYHLCQFQYFCKYGLRAKERKPSEITALEYGSLMHYLLEILFSTIGYETLVAYGSEELKALLLQTIDQYVDENMNGMDRDSKRNQMLFDRLAEAAAVVVRHIAEELQQSGFVPYGYEMTLRRGGDFPPLTLPLDDGGEVTVIGVVDRVDLYVENDVQYVRIIDYKTGTKEFKLFDILNGINMQMLIYLAALIEKKRFRPAGVLYMPASKPVVSVEKDASPKDILLEVRKKLRMNGLLVDDPVVLAALEEEPGTYIKNMKRGEKPTVTEFQMEGVLRYIKTLVGEMAQSLHRGEVADAPLKGCYDGCAYCPYFAICCHEDEAGGRMRLKVDKEAALEALVYGRKEEKQDESKVD